MLENIINAWDILYYSLQGVCTVFVAVLKPLFTTPLALFTIPGLISLWFSLKRR